MEKVKRGRINGWVLPLLEMPNLFQESHLHRMCQLATPNVFYKKETISMKFGTHTKWFI